MKNYLLPLFGLAVFSFILPAHLSAQGSSSGTAVVVQKITDHDGNVIIKKKRIESDEALAEYIDLIKEETEGKNIEISITTNGEAANASAESFNFEFENSVVYMREAGEQGHQFPEKFHFKFKDHFDSERWSNQPENKVLLGVYPGESVNKGLRLSGIVHQGSASKAGLQEDDIITTIDGEAVTSSGTLRTVLSKYNPGDEITVVYLRDGSQLQAKVVLSERQRENGFSYGYQRDPCKVFIGVFTTVHSSGKGRVVTSTIFNTSAEEAGVMAGDVILALDGVEVTTHQELVSERDKHQPGEEYVLTINRDGSIMNISGRFQSCEEEVVEPLVEDPLPELDEPAAIPNSTLTLEEFTAFPNPTFGNVNVTFRAEALPTTVQVSDMSGKVVYREVLNNFDGYYNKEVDLGNATPGTLTVSIIQEGKIQSKPIMLLNRA